MRATRRLPSNSTRFAMATPVTLPPSVVGINANYPVADSWISLSGACLTTPFLSAQRQTADAVPALHVIDSLPTSQLLAFLLLIHPLGQKRCEAYAISVRIGTLQSFCVLHRPSLAEGQLRQKRRHLGHETRLAPRTYNTKGSTQPRQFFHLGRVTRTHSDASRNAGTDDSHTGGDGQLHGQAQSRASKARMPRR